MVSRHTGHSNVSATASCKDTLACRFLPEEAMVLVVKPSRNRSETDYHRIVSQFVNNLDKDECYLIEICWFLSASG